MTQPYNPGYPAAPPQTPAPYPQQGQYPQAPAPGYPQYPAQPAYPQTPAEPAEEKATLSDFWDQPAGGAKPLQWNTPGTTYTAVVSRPITDADTENQKDKNGQLRRFRDRTIMKMLKIPLLMNPTAEYPDGTASFYVKGNDTAELKRALGEAGMNPNQPPPMGTVITVQYTHDRPVPGGFNPAKVKRITLQRPQGMAPHQDQQEQGNGQAPQPVAQPAPPVGQQPVPQPAGQIPAPGPIAPGTAAAVQQVLPQVPPPVQPYPAPGAPLSVPPSPAPAGTNPYNNPALPPNQPDVAGQVAYATQAGITAAQQAQAPQQGQQPAPPPAMSAENAALIAQLTGQAPLQ